MRNNTAQSSIHIRVDGIRYAIEQSIVDMNSQLSDKLQEEVSKKLTPKYIESLIQHKVEKELECILDQHITQALEGLSYSIATDIADSIEEWEVFDRMKESAREKIIEHLGEYES